MGRREGECAWEGRIQKVSGPRVPPTTMPQFDSHSCQQAELELLDPHRGDDFHAGGWGGSGWATPPGTGRPDWRIHVELGVVDAPLPPMSSRRPLLGKGHFKGVALLASSNGEAATPQAH